MKTSRYTFSLLSTLFVLGSLSTFSTQVFADSLGNSGSDGRDGQDGSWGEDGDDQVIFLKGMHPVPPLNIDGGRGGDGKNGQDGEDANNCFNVDTRQAHNDFTAAKGGDGGKGGNGGRGGDGGDVTIYYQDLAQLSFVYINAEGGEGGDKGYGGRAGDGCDCNVDSWSFTIRCGNNTAATDCKDKVEHFQCTEQGDGIVRGDGIDGGYGDDGTVTLIRREMPLGDDHPVNVHQVNASSLGREFVVNRHQWQDRQGMRSLLAHGSKVSDRYREFTHTEEAAYRIVWNDNRSPEQFDLKASVNLAQASNVDVQFSGNAMANATVHMVGGVNVISVDKVFLRSELENFVVGKMEGRGRKAVLNILDKNNLGLVGNISVRLTVKSKKLVDVFKPKIIKDVYVSNDLVTQTEEGAVIKIGKLVEHAEKEFEKEGQKFSIDVTVTRNWEGQSVSKSFEDIERELK